MAARPFHLAWLTGFQSPPEDSEFVGRDATEWAGGDYHVALVQALERARFDFLLLDDSSLGGDAAEPRPSTHDPVLLAPFLIAATERLGLVATLSTSLYPPFMLARTMTTLDHMSRGRIGWNIATALNDRSAQNYGLAAVGDSGNRWERAEEFLEVATSLWESWEPDALVMDQVAGRYVDHTKVHTIDHDGKYFKVRGPMNTLRSPQGRPVFCQAATSPRELDFAAQHADTLIASAVSVEAMTVLRSDFRRRMAGLDRDPDSGKVLFRVTLTVGATDDEARAAWERSTRPALDDSASYPIVGTSQAIAAELDEIMQQVGGDGFVITGAHTRRQIAEICDGLVPALQARGLTRTEYQHEQFRDNLLHF